jgi:hypothetical protein
LNDWIAPIPTEYGGKLFRSRLEAWWASALDSYGIRWDYEPDGDDGRPLVLTLPSGARYQPDFWLPDLKTVIEVKGAHMQRVDKTRELAQALAPGVIVLLGWAPDWCREAGKPESLMRWEDAAGYNALLGECHCGAWQWFRPRFSINCKKCGERAGAGTHLASGHGGDAVPFSTTRASDMKLGIPSLFAMPGAA